MSHAVAYKIPKPSPRKVVAVAHERFLKPLDWKPFLGWGGGGVGQGLKIEKAALTQNLQTKQLETGYHQFTFYICQTEEILI